MHIQLSKMSWTNLNITSWQINHKILLYGILWYCLYALFIYSSCLLWNDIPEIQFGFQLRKIYTLFLLLFTNLCILPMKKKRRASYKVFSALGYDQWLFFYFYFCIHNRLSYDPAKMSYFISDAFIILADGIHVICAHVFRCSDVK